MPMMRIFDLETAPLEYAGDFLPPLDLDTIQPARNLVKAETIKADLEKRRAAAEAEYIEKLERAALDWNLARIVAAGWTDDGGRIINVLLCHDDAAEAKALRTFWGSLDDRKLCGFCARTFDVPMLIQRSRYLGVDYPEISLARFRGRRGDVIDIRDELTFDDARYEAIMPRSLKSFAKRIGLAIDDPVDGKDVAALIALGDYAAVEGHVRSDVRLTAQLADWLRLIDVAQPGLTF